MRCLGVAAEEQDERPLPVDSKRTTTSGGDSEQDLQRAEYGLNCAKPEKGGLGGEVSPLR